uniref:Uncharacterized protein n=1 Tax=Nelumbo nucifera TaxID=4432 RepID=A0A822YWT3_NELNU|nr:TPA_asm: hypothetical protein HUJ06_012866 [Nelumbo nucifera]
MATFVLKDPPRFSMKKFVPAFWVLKKTQLQASPIHPLQLAGNETGARGNGGERENKGEEERKRGREPTPVAVVACDGCAQRERERSTLPSFFLPLGTAVVGDDNHRRRAPSLSFLLLLVSYKFFLSAKTNTTPPR